MRELIGNLSNERLEQEIGALYWRAFEDAPGVVLRETGVLGELWAEFDRRIEAGEIEREPWTGSEEILGER